MKFVRKGRLLKESINNKTIADIMNRYFTVIDIGADDQFIIKQENGDKFEAVILGNGVSILPADKFSSRKLAGEIEEFLNRKIREKMNNVSRSSERSFIGSSELNEEEVMGDNVVTQQGSPVDEKHKQLVDGMDSDKLHKLLQEFYKKLPKEVLSNVYKSGWDKEKYSMWVNWKDPNTHKNITSYYSISDIANHVNINYYANQKKTTSEAVNRIKSFENEWLNESPYYEKPEPKYTSGQKMDPVDNILEEIKLLGRKLPMVLKVRINKESVNLARLEFELDGDEVIDGSEAGKILSNLVAGKFKEAGLNPDEYINPAKRYDSRYNPQWKGLPGEYDNRYCRFVQYGSKYGDPIAIFSINRVAGGKGISSAIGGDVLTDAIKEAKKYFRGQGIVRHFRDMSKSGVIRIKFAVEPYDDIITHIREVFEEYIGDALIDVKVINTPYDHYSWHNKDQMIAVYVNASKIDDMNREVGMKGYAGEAANRIKSFEKEWLLKEEFSIEHKVPDWEEQSGILRAARKIQKSTNNAIELRDIDYDKNSNQIIAIFYCPTTEQEVILRPEGNNQYSIEEWNMISSLLGIIRQINDRFGE